MKLTKEQLKRIIKEELQAVMGETEDPLSYDYDGVPRPIAPGQSGRGPQWDGPGWYEVHWGKGVGYSKGDIYSRKFLTATQLDNYIDDRGGNVDDGKLLLVPPNKEPTEEEQVKGLEWLAHQEGHKGAEKALEYLDDMPFEQALSAVTAQDMLEKEWLEKLGIKQGPQEET